MGECVADSQAPSVPANLSASNVTSTSAVLNWTASTDNVGVAGYDIYSGSILAGFSAINSATIQNLLPGTTYTFSVKAKDGVGHASAASASVVITTVPTQDVTPPSAPSNLAWVNDNGTVTLSC
jgi:chitinase